MNKPLRVLLIDTNKDLLSFNKDIMAKEGYQVTTCNNPLEALKIALTELPKIIITELIMPEMDGIELCSSLRENNCLADTAIVFYTERNDDYSQIAALNAGADDYIIKPVRGRLLLARIKVLLKRDRVIEVKSEIIKEGLQINKEEYLVYKDGIKIIFPRKEFEIIHLLSKTPKKIVTREELSNLVWGYEIEKENRTLDVHMRKIRKKLGNEYIKTIRGVGYLLNTELQV